MSKETTRVLLNRLDLLIQKYENTQPEIAEDLRAHRDALQEHLRHGKPLERVKAVLQIATWIKFVIDHLPDG